MGGLKTAVLSAMLLGKRLRLLEKAVKATDEVPREPCHRCRAGIAGCRGV